MEKCILKPPKSLLLLAPVVFFILVFIPSAMVMHAFRDGSLIYGLVAIIIAIGGIYVTVILIYNALWGAIILDNQGLTMRTAFPFKTYNLLWEDISEVSRYRGNLGYGGPVWEYDIKSRNFGNKKFRIGIQTTPKINEALSIIFERAKNAKFITIDNISKIPLVRKREITEWKREDLNSS